MTPLRKLALAGLVCSLPASASAGVITGARVLTYPASARSLALAEAFTAVADDWTAVYANPGGLGAVDRTSFGATYFQGLADTAYTSLGVVVPAGPALRLGGGVAYLDGGSLDLAFPDGRERTVKASQDYVLTVSGGLNLYRKNCVGLSLKVLHSRLAQEASANTFALDGGLRYALWEDDLTLGVVVKNLGPRLRYEEEGDLLPASVQAGLAYVCDLTREWRLRLTLDAYKPLDQNFKALLGAEVSVWGSLALRLGYKTGYELIGLTTGLGFGIAGVTLDYALVPRSDLGLNHLVTLGVSF